MTYCPTCYRTLEDADARCFSCEVERHRAEARPSSMWAVIAVVLLGVGMLGHDSRLGLAAAIVGGSVVIVSLIRTLRARP